MISFGQMKMMDCTCSEYSSFCLNLDLLSIHNMNGIFIRIKNILLIHNIHHKIYF